MRDNPKVAWKFGAFAAVALALLAVLYNSIALGSPGGSTTYTAEFTDVSGLRAGDDVRIAGVRVGEVSSISVDGDSARVAFTVGPGHPFTTTTGLILKYQNLIGQRYLDLVGGPAGGVPQQPSNLIPESRTSPGFDLTALLNGFRPLFQVLQPADVNKLSSSILQVLQGEGGTIDGVLQQTTQLTNYLADRDDLFHQVAANLVPVLGEISGDGSQLAGTVHQLSLLTTGLAANRATIASSIDSMSSLLGRVDATVHQIKGPLTGDIAKLQQVLRVYAATKNAYAAAPAQFGTVLGVLGRLLSYRSAVNLYYCTVHVVVGGLNLNTDPPGSKYSKVCR